MPAISAQQNITEKVISSGGKDHNEQNITTVFREFEKQRVARAQKHKIF